MPIVPNSISQEALFKLWVSASPELTSEEKEIVINAFRTLSYATALESLSQLRSGG